MQQLKTHILPESSGPKEDQKIKTNVSPPPLSHALEGLLHFYFRPLSGSFTSLHLAPSLSFSLPLPLYFCSNGSGWYFADSTND